MPLYGYKCEAGHVFDRYLKLAQHAETQFCICGCVAEKQVCAPYVRGDLPEYVSPVTGKPISGRVARREDLRRSGSVEWEPGMKERHRQRVAEEEAKLDAAIDETVEREIHAMPTRKRESLISEMEGGLSAKVIRSTPNVG